LVFTYCGLPPVFGLHVLFPSDCHVCYWWLLCPTFPHSITMRTPVLTTTSTHPSRSLPPLPARVVKLSYLVVTSRVQSPITPYSSFLNPCQPPLPPVPPFFIDTPCHFFFSNVDLLVVHTALRLIITPRRPYIPLIFLLDMVIVFICVHLQCVLLRCSVLEEDKRKDRISRVAVYDR